MRLKIAGDRALFRCPGCNIDHEVAIGTASGWQFNGDCDRPTLNPSVLVRWTFESERLDKVCHSFVKDGQIQFLGDCTHNLAGQTVELPELADGQ